MAVEVKKKILVVDDEDGLRELLRLDLEDEGFDVIEANSGDSAFELLQTTSVDLVISDIRMPKGNGIELVRKIKARDAKVPTIILLTGFADLAIDEAYNLGVAGIMSKPWDAAALTQMIKKCLVTPSEKWTRLSPRVDVSWTLDLKCDGFANGLNSHTINIGRGGMFVAIPAPHPLPLAEISFTFGAPQGKTIAGTGIVRWSRTEPKDGLPVGVGVEFVVIEPEHKKEFDELLSQLETRAFIPKSF